MTATDSQDTRSKLIQIFRYLQALNQLRNPVQREVNDYTWKLWFHDLPNHPCIRFGAISEVPENIDDIAEEPIEDENDFVLKVKRPLLTNPPAPPKDLLSWLQSGWQDINGNVIIKSTFGVEEENTIQHFNDNPHLQLLLEDWVLQRDKWVANERPSHDVSAIFDQLYKLYNQLERESERLEIAIGDGILEWQPDSNISIHHPLLLLPLQLRFDPKIPEFTIVEANQTSELYTAVFQAIPGVNTTEITHCRIEHEQENWHPRGGAEVDQFFKRLVNCLSSQGIFLPNAIRSQNKRVPSISRDAVLFVRPRTQGISTAIESILEILADENALPSLPYALTSLTGLGTPMNTLENSSNHFSPNGEDEIILLSKPANAEQLEIARKLDRYGAVLVQGPPGTGKTHTIANLIGYLLSQGKRVLVTSEKSKALRVLREKVVEPLQPLCVSVLDDENHKQMGSAIDIISERLANTDADTLRRDAERLKIQRIGILHQLQETRHALAEARGSEYRPIVLAGQSYTPSEAARFVSQHKETANWIPGPVAPEAPLPLSISELLELYNSNAHISTEDEREIALPLPESRTLPTPVEFEQYINKQTTLQTNNLAYRRDLWFTTSENRSPEILLQLQQQFLHGSKLLSNATGWQLAAISAGRNGEVWLQIWNDLLNRVVQTHSFAAQAQRRILEYDPAISSNCLNGRLEKTLDEIIDYLKQGGKLNRLLPE